MIGIVDLQAGGASGLAAALFAGFAFSFTPVSLAAIPAVAAYVTKARAFREALLMGASFAAGMVVTHVVLGILAAASGRWIEQWVGPAWGVVTGPLLIFLGLIWTGLIKVPLPRITLRGRRVATVGGAFALGVPFSVGICPVCSPGLWIGLGASAVVGSVGYGALLMFMFAIGRMTPILLGAVSMGWLESLRPVVRFRRTFEVLGGSTLIVLGLYLLNDYYQWI